MQNKQKLKLENIISEVVKNHLGGGYSYKLRESNDFRTRSLFEEVIVESDSNITNDVLDKIRNNQWEPQNPQRFKEALSKSKHKEMLSDYSTSELGQMKLFKLEGYDIGFALKMFNGRYSEFVSLFNNEPEAKGIGKELVNAAVKNGGCYLDHFDGYLSNLYQSLGFEEYKRDKFDPQYDQDGSFRSKYGEADVIYRKHKNCK